MPRRLLPLALLAVVAFAATMTVAPRDARADFFSVWAQGHGSLTTGGGQYFDSLDGSALGPGAELGIQVLMIQAYADFTLHSFADEGAMTDDSSGRVHWNHIGLGTRLGLPIPGDRFNIYGLASINYLNADYRSDGDPTDGTNCNQGCTTVQNEGPQFRIGGGIEVKIVSVIYAGTDLQAGYHVLGTDESGADFQARLFLRFRLGI